MSVAAHSKIKIDAILQEIQRLKASEFAYRDSKTALDLIEGIFLKDRSRLEIVLNEAEETLKEHVCAKAIEHVADFLPVLGLILRSTNVRNAFEFYEPVLRLARILIGDENVKLVLSSEWEYSPFTYPPVIEELPNFILIGLPAFESANGLILPLAGHELGHSVWVKERFSDILQTEIQDGIIREIKAQWSTYTEFFPDIRQTDLFDLLGRPTWAGSYLWCDKQCEEIFCDFVGIRVFGESYIYSFEYLLAPNLGDFRSPLYPSMQKRAEFLEQAGREYRVSVPDGYSKQFKDERSPFVSSEKESFLLSISDGVTKSLVDKLIRLVKEFASQKKVPYPRKKMADRIHKCFENLVPAFEVDNLADIINAGWKAWLDNRLWENIPSVAGRRREVLNELILKSIEVMEFETRIRSD